MRTLKRGSYARLSSFESLWHAWLQCRRGKRRTPAVAHFEIDCDRHLLALRRDLTAHCYRPGYWRLHGIRDPKVRLIAAPDVRDRVLHHAVLSEIGPVFERRYIDQSFAAGTGRGPHRATLHYLACQRRHRWRLHLDIAGYFLSIEHRRLLALFRYRVRDEDTQALLWQLIVDGGRVYRNRLARGLLGGRCPGSGHGMALGSWFSQWCGNFYLDGLDHLIKRELRIPGYLRYMDDFVLFDDDRDKLHNARTAIAEWLRQERGLALNPKHQAVIPTTHPGVFVGYRISRAGITPSRKLRRRLGSRVKAAAARGEDALMRTITSYRGLLLFP